MKSVLSLGMALALASPCSALAPAMTQIGVAGGVRGAVKAFPPGDKPVGRILASGQPLYLNEKIATGPQSSLQVMLIDETVFTIGPNSSMVLDEFVYDPGSRSGKVTATVTNGIFRFITGQIGHRKPSNMKVKFPVGTMGIRGTIVAGEVSEKGVTAVLLGPGPLVNAPGERVGAFNLENAGTKVDVVKPGYGSTISGRDSAPTPPALMAAAQLNSILGKISPETAAQAGARPGTAPSAPGAAAPDATGATSDQSASDDSGQTTADAQGDLSNTQSVFDVSTDLSAAETFISEDAAFDAFILANQATWDDVRMLTTGNGYYSGTGNFVMTACNPGPCGNPGTITMNLDIDFGARTVGSAASSLVLTNNDAGVGVPINATATFAQTSFAALSGNAVIPATGLGAGMTSASISLLNVGGLAGAAVGKASYSSGGNVGTGNVAAPLTCTSPAGCF